MFGVQGSWMGLMLSTCVFVSACGHILSAEEEQQYLERKSKVEISVADWIMKHARYPDSYKSIGFSEYSESYSKRHDERIINTENYVIKHIHQILDVDSNLQTFSGYFILDFDFSVNIIETERSNATGKAFPPRLKVWTEKFGRPFNREDSLELEKKHEQVKKRIVNELKGGLDKGDIYTEDPGDIEKLRQLIDTLDVR